MESDEYEGFVYALECRYCIESDYTGEAHPVALAMERLSFVAKSQAQTIRELQRRLEEMKHA